MKLIPKTIKTWRKCDIYTCNIDYCFGFLDSVSMCVYVCVCVCLWNLNYF